MMPFRWRRQSKSRVQDSKSEEEDDDDNKKKHSNASLLRKLFRRGPTEENKKKQTKQTQGDKVVKSDKLEPPRVAVLTQHQQVGHENQPDENAIAAAGRLDEKLLQTLFSGAPRFSVLSIDRQQVPKVSFPWNSGLIVLDVSDSTPLEHPAYATATLRKHFIASNASASRRPSGVVEYDIETVEVPSMLSARGCELGTFGFDYFLQDAIGDAMEVSADEQPLSDTVFDAFTNHEYINSSPEKIGIRKFNMDAVGERLVELIELHQLYRETAGTVHALKKYTPAELYTALFTKLLTPPKLEVSMENPAGLKVQIEALLKALKLKGIWFDFSSVEWRIRLGQILWATTSRLESLSDAEDTDEEEGLTDRDLLILQITLSCELLIRLDAISAMSANEVRDDLNISSDDVLAYRKVESTRATRWDLVLARRFLENIEVRAMTREIEVPMQPKPQGMRGFFSIATSPISLAERLDKKPRVVKDLIFSPRNIEQQLAGLFYFAKRLVWPEVEDFEERLRSRVRGHEEDLTLPSPSIYSTPMATTPRSVTSARSSYFDPRPHGSRTPTPRAFLLQPSMPNVEATLSADGDTNKTELGQGNIIGGWLTRTYVTGLVMPGEVISHFLISALLENDPGAIACLGDSASLYGGFMYKGRSWWSKSCIVGRVLAASRGAKECMGWIFVPHAPKGVQEGWFDVQSEAIQNLGSPRITSGDAVEADSAFLGDKAAKDSSMADLVLPQDRDEKPGGQVRFEGFYLHVQSLSLGIMSSEVASIASVSEAADLSPSLQPYLATLRFLSTTSGERDLSLFHLVSFVSAFPCTPTPATTITAAAAVVGKDQIPKQPSDKDGAGTKAEAKVEKVSVVMVHPLHISHKYTLVDAAAVASEAFVFPARPSSPSPPPSPSLQQHQLHQDLAASVRSERSQQLIGSPKVPAGVENMGTLVLDARGSPTLELLARTWCSWRGEHAIVSRVAVTCLACSIREARALDIRVVIRVE